MMSQASAALVAWEVSMPVERSADATIEAVKTSSSATTARRVRVRAGMSVMVLAPAPSSPSQRWTPRGELSRSGQAAAPDQYRLSVVASPAAEEARAFAQRTSTGERVVSDREDLPARGFRAHGRQCRPES